MILRYLKGLQFNLQLSRMRSILEVFWFILHLKNGINKNFDLIGILYKWSLNICTVHLFINLFTQHDFIVSGTTTTCQENKSGTSQSSDVDSSKVQEDNFENLSLIRSQTTDQYKHITHGLIKFCDRFSFSLYIFFLKRDLSETTHTIKVNYYPIRTTTVKE